MKAIPGKFRKLLFGLPYEEASFKRRGFHSGEASARAHLERIGEIFLQGYHAALEEDDLECLSDRLNTIALELRGFAFEGAAMAVSLLDQLTPWSRDGFFSFLRGPGAEHLYMLHVGSGWAFARLHRSANRFLPKHDPLLRWLIMDGYGFHEGYFHWPHYISSQKMPARLTGYELRSFYQGLGRSLWFVDGADVERIPKSIAAFSERIQADLWSGIGLACAYAGGSSGDSILILQKSASFYTDHLAQGAAFAAQARQRAGNPAAHTEIACQILCGMPARAAAQITEMALTGLCTEDSMPAFEVWRRRIREAIKQKSLLGALSRSNDEEIRS